MPPPRPRGFSSGSGGCLTPMSERQQMALLMQMTSSASLPSSSSSSEMSPGSSSHVPARSRDRNERGETALHVAAIKGDQDGVKKLLDSGMSPNVPDFAGWTPLHEACNHAHYNVAFTLIKGGANVNSRGLDDDTPLHDAATIGHLKLVKLLVDKGADVHFKNRKGKSALDVAHTTVVPYLQSIKDSSTSSRSSQQIKKSADQKKQTEEIDSATISSVPISGGQSTAASASLSSTAAPTTATTSAKDEEDIYEFKSTPKDSFSSSGSSSDDKLDNRKILENRSTLSSDDINTDGTTLISSEHLASTSASNLSVIGGSSSGSGSATASTNTGPSKRGYSDVEGCEDTNTDTDDNKRKKRKDSDNVVKDVCSSKSTASGRGAPQRQEKTTKQLNISHKTAAGSSSGSGGSGSGCSSSASSGGGTGTGTSNIITGKTNTNLDRKSPCATSPKPVLSNKTAASAAATDSDAETDDSKNNEIYGLSGPKVPPLKIVIPQQNSSGDNDIGPRNGKNNSTRNHAALPYVVASSSNSNDSVAADRESTSSRCASPADSTGKVGTSNVIGGSLTEDKNMKATSEERAQQRVLRSSHRSGGQSVDRGSNNSSPQLQNSSPSPAPPNSNIDGGGADSGSNKNTNTNNPSPVTHTSNQSENDGAGGGNVPSPSASSTCSSKEIQQNIVELHPRKRKIRTKQEDNVNKSSTSNPTNQNCPSEGQGSTTSSEVHPHDHPFTNCYQMYLNIRKQIERKHRSLVPIQPRPPQGFKDYLLNRRTYVLAGKTPAEPVIEYPHNMPIQMNELFAKQEKERYKLKMQHIVEKEKLGLTVEQEILRVHAKAARSLSCQSLPFSACTLLRDEEIYNMITPEQEEKDRNARSRYNGRLFLSWLQDVDDKWEKIKDSMLLRHHNEAESLHAVQKMDWEWVMKEHSLCDYKSQPVIDEFYVPMVHVSDDFDLLPA